MANQPILFINGEYKPLSETTISVLDQGFLLGDGVFDVVSAWKGVIFKLDQHLDRFFDSLRATRLQTPMSREDWRAAIVETVRRNQLRDATIRFIVTRGVPKAVVADPRDFQPTMIVWAAPYIFLADEATRRKGIRLFISHLRAFSADTLDPRYKCLDRLHSQMARIEALEAGYDDVIWLDQAGNVCEGPASNIFVIKEGVVRTPRRNVLRGITRQTFIELARDAALPVEEADLTAFDLYAADEVFTCSTAGGALAVREVAGRPLAGSVPGPLTQKLGRLYWTLRESGAHGTPIPA
ncbi:MAG: branched-chain amino acid aminotransferase [Alphaproteobacteria bacterium]|nr:branched-chain amino acid aminotransferase [Alphaproteobacteria bacterium]